MSKPIIRLAEPQDTTQMLEIYAPFILYSTTSFELSVPSEEAFWLRVKKVIKQSPWLVCEIDGKIAGYAYASEHRGRAAYQWNREVSAYVHPDFRGRSIATALYQTLFKLLKYQGFANLLAGIVLPNAASVGFHEQQGFQLVGVYHSIGYKMGAWQEVGWWELPLVEKSTIPQAIRSMEDLLSSQEFKTILGSGADYIKPV